MLNRPNLQYLIYGDPGSGKSHFASTFPKPMLVLCMDPRGKAMPYMRWGKVTEEGVENGTPYQLVGSKKSGKTGIRIEYYQDDNIRGGNSTIYAYERFEERLVSLANETYEGKWKTVVLDSLSFLEFHARKAQQYKFNATSNAGHTQDRRQWYDASSDCMEEICYSVFAGLPVNFVALGHVSDTRVKIRDSFAFTVEAPGFKGRKLPGAFSEVYVLHCTSEGRYLQTENDTNFIATSQIGAPNGGEPDYRKLWQQWDEWEKEHENNTQES